MTLAIVDDDEGVRRAVARLLGCLGHEVRVFASAEEFEAQSAFVDCLVVDVRMPGVSGLELRDRLRDRVPPIPVVLITGDMHSKTQDSLRGIDSPSVTKPFDAVTLMSAIANAIASTKAAEPVYPPPTRIV
jgi:FixJ family two-component response regulator